MSVKSRLLSLLEAGRGTNLSGEQLAVELGVSRTAVWKAVNALREEGYQIEAGNNRGYRLQKSSDVLSQEGIRPRLDDRCRKIVVEVHKILDSTNEEAKRRLLDGAEEGLVVLAEQQTKGKGRLGRNFYSPSGTGIYMSILLRPQVYGPDVILITTAASVAVCRGLEKVLGISAQIKWVNDVYVDERKVCGILTEAISDSELGKIDSVIVGIGINYRTEEFPEEIRERAGAVAKTADVPRNYLVAAVINEFWKIYEEIPDHSFLKDYKERSNVIGRDIRFQERGVWQEAKAVDIDDDGGLVVEYWKETGEAGKAVEKVVRTLHTGEITLRVK